MQSLPPHRRARFAAAPADPLLAGDTPRRHRRRRHPSNISDDAAKARIHRVRFVDYKPAAIASLALTPSSWDPSTTFSHARQGREVLAVGRGNGDIDIHVYIGVDGEELTRRPSSVRTDKQAWVIEKTLPAHLPSGPAEHVAFAHQTVVSESDADLMSSASELASTKARLKRTPPRLFASTGSSTLYEWDWIGAQAGKPKTALPTEGGNIWSLAVNPSGTMLAMGCEDGVIRLVSLWDGDFEIVRRLDKVNARSLSLAWGPQAPIKRTADVKGKGKARATAASDDDEVPTEIRYEDVYLVAGAADTCLRKFDVRSGRCVARMSTDRVGREPTLVWTVGVLSDHTIISGDSMGVVKFWDGVMGTQLQSHKAHKADVLCMAVAPDEQSVLTSGVDQTTMQFTLINPANSQEPIAGAASRLPVPSARPQWLITSTRRMHSHDVRAIVMSPSVQPSHIPALSRTSTPKPTHTPLQISGGIDMLLSILCAGSPSASPYSRAVMHLGNPLNDSPTVFDKTSPRKISYVPQRNVAVHVAREGRLLVARHATSLTIWRLKAGFQPPSSATDSGNGLDESESGWQRAAELTLKCSTTLITSAVSPDGQWLAVSDRYEARLFRLQDAADGSIDPKRSKAFTQAIEGSEALGESRGAVNFTFTPDSRRIVVATLGTSLLAVFSLPTDAKSKKCQVLKVFRQHAQLARPGRAIAGPAARRLAANGKSAVLNGNGNGRDHMSSSSSSVGDEVEEEELGTASVATIACLAVSDDGQWLASSDMAHRLHVYHLDSLQHQCALPSPELPATSLAFIPQSPSHLIVALPNNTLQIFDVEARRLAPWAQSLVAEPIEQLHGMNDSLIGLALEPVAPRGTGSASATASPMPMDGLVTPLRHSSATNGRNSSLSLSSGSPGPRSRVPVLIAWGASWVCRMRLPGAVAPVSGRTSTTPLAGKRRAPGDDKVVTNGKGEDLGSTSEDDEDDGAGTGVDVAPLTISHVSVVHKYQSLLALDFLAPGELVVVERPYHNLVVDLPQAYYRAGRYGT